MPVKQRVKRAALVAPQNLQQAAEYVAKIGELQRALEKNRVEMNEEIENLKQKFMNDAAQLVEEMETHFAGLHAYAEANREELTAEGKKTVELPTGTMAWRLTPKAVVAENVKAIIAYLKKKRMKKFLRIKEEINKEAMLHDEKRAAKVPGISFTQREEFVVKPADSKAEVLAQSDKGKIKKVVVKEIKEEKE